jgi:hypothetical protein
LGTLVVRELRWPPLAAAAGCLLALVILVAPGTPSPGTSQGGGELETSIAEAPLAFEPNAGRTDRRVDFLAHSVAGGNLYLTSREAVLSLPQGKNDSRALRLGFPGADPDAEARGLEGLLGKANSFIGDDPSKWRSGIPTYGRVRYSAIYPGIDVDFYGNQRDLEYDLRVAPHTDPGRIAIELSGADSVRLGQSGDLVIEVGRATVRQRAPIAYQRVGGEREPVAAAFDLAGSTVSFDLGPYDHSRRLVIDPLVLAYSTYLGGSDSDTGSAIAVDSAGAAYVAGQTTSANFPTQDAFQTDPGTSNDAFVTKFNSESSGALTLAYSTYLGGTDDQQDFARGIALDPAGAAYVTGGTFSTDFPTEDQFQTDPGDSNSDVFLTKLNPDGGGGAVTLGYSTYLGGSGLENGHAVAVDELGTAYVAGATGSANFPTLNSFQPDQPGFDAFATKFNPEPPEATEPSASDDVTRTFSTYLGGNAADGADGIAIGSETVDPFVIHPVYVTGATHSTDFPIQDPFQATHGGGVSDAFVTKLNLGFFASAVTLQYSTYLGGGANDSASAIAVDPAGAAYVTGDTVSANFPLQDPLQNDQPVQDAFVTKLDPKPNSDPATLAYSTYLGGAGTEDANGIALDSAGSAYVTGLTSSPDFPVRDPLQPLLLQDAFVTELEPGSAAVLGESTYLGGSSSETGESIAVDSSGGIYLTGSVNSTDFPLQDPFQGDQPQRDAFAAKLVLEPPPAPEAPPSPTPFKAPRTVTLDASKAKAKKAGKGPLLAVKKGKKARFSGRVSAPQDVAGCQANQGVELQRRKPKGVTFTTFEQLQTDAAGNFSTKEKIKKTFEYRAILAETAGCDDAASGSEKVKAKKKK